MAAGSMAAERMAAAVMLSDLTGDEISERLAVACDGDPRPVYQNLGGQRP